MRFSRSTTTGKTDGEREGLNVILILVGSVFIDMWRSIDHNLYEQMLHTKRYEREESKCMQNL